MAWSPHQSFFYRDVKTFTCEGILKAHVKFISVANSVLPTRAIQERFVHK